MKNFLTNLSFPFKFSKKNNQKESKITTFEARDFSASKGGFSYSVPLNTGAKYPGGLSNYGNSQIIANKTIRQNARNAFHDTPEAKALVSRFADTIVDKGLKLECTINSNILGISKEEAEEWERNVEERFDLFAKSKDSDRSGINNFYQNQRLYQIFQQRDNDIFTRLHYSKDKKIINPLQISFIDPNQIRSDSYTSTYSFSSLNDGIDRDEKGQEISYNMFVRNDKTGELKPVSIPRVGKKSGRKIMLHGFMPEYANQGRGYSRLEHVLQEFENLTDFKLSNIKKAISQSQITMYTKPSKDDDASNPLEEIARFKSGPIVSSSEASGESSSEDLSGCHIEYQQIPEAEVSTPGSMAVFNLKRGEDLKPFETQMASEAFDKFIESYMSYISASTGMPNEVLLMKFGQNYSASRGALILFWRVVGIWRDEMASDFLNPIYEAWLSEEIASGRISAPGFSDPVLKKAWLNCGWIGAPMPNIDPLKAAKSDMLYAEMGATTLDRIAINHNGSNGSSNRAKLKKEYGELGFPTWKRIPPEELEEEEEEDDKQ